MNEVWVRVIVEDGEHRVVCRLQDWELQEVRGRDVAQQILWNAYENCRMRLLEKLGEERKTPVDAKTKAYFLKAFEEQRRKLNARPPEQERPHGWGAK